MYIRDFEAVQKRQSPSFISRCKNSRLRLELLNPIILLIPLIILLTNNTAALALDGPNEDESCNKSICAGNVKPSKTSERSCVAVNCHYELSRTVTMYICPQCNKTDKTDRLFHVLGSKMAI